MRIYLYFAVVLAYISSAHRCLAHPLFSIRIKVSSLLPSSYCFSFVVRSLSSSHLRFLLLDASPSSSMASKADHPKVVTRSLGVSKVTEDSLKEMVEQGQLVAGVGRPPRVGETSAYPEADEVVVFCTLFIAGLHFSLDP